MGKKDAAENQFLMNKERIADLLNAVVYDGEEIFKPENVKAITPVVTKTWWSGNTLKSQINITDAACLAARRMLETRVYIQNQTETHYVMPVRTMNGEASDYYNQWKDAEKEHRERHNFPTREETLSGFCRGDRLTGVVTLVVYYGRKPWNGVLNLKKLIRRSLPEDDRMLDFMADYPVNLVDVRRFEHTEYFRTDLREVFTFLQKDNDKDALNKYVKENAGYFSDMPEDAFELLAALSSVRPILKQKNQYIDEERGRGDMGDMCKALRDMEKESEARGEARGKVLGEEHLGDLALRMEKDNRMADFLRGVRDKCYLMNLYEEYGI